MQEIPRRTFLAGGLAAGSLVLVACSSDEPEPGAEWQGDGSDPADFSDELTFLTPTFPDGFRQASVLVAGVPQRLAFVVRDEIDFMRESAPATIAVRIFTTDGTTEETVLETTVDQRSDGIITPYYPIAFTFDAAGEYRADLPDFPEVGHVPFIVLEAGTATIPQVGDPLPVVATPTTTDALGVNPICTRAIDCPFHEHDLADVVGNGRPTVLLIATPGFCQTDICGPVVDLLIDEVSDRADLDVIHAEVYVDPSDFETGSFPDLTAIVNEMALPFEPALFVADAAGLIVARVDTTFDRSELRDALALV